MQITRFSSYLKQSNIQLSFEHEINIENVSYASRLLHEREQIYKIEGDDLIIETHHYVV